MSAARCPKIEIGWTFATILQSETDIRLGFYAKFENKV